jgi:hypothetical protein
MLLYGVMHVDLVLVAVAIALYLWNKYIPAPRPWIGTVKMVVSAVVTLLTLVWLLIITGYAAGDGPFFGPASRDEWRDGRGDLRDRR